VIALAGALAGVVLTHAVTGLLGAMGAMLVALAVVLTVAGRLGARAGLVAGAFTAVLIAWWLPSAEAPQAGVIQHVFEVTIFATLGLAVGSLRDGLSHEQDMRAALMRAAQELEVAGEEAAIRRTLLENLSHIDPAGLFEVCDELGGVIAYGRGAAAWRADEVAWNTRALQADGRQMGVVRWRLGGPSARGSDDLAAAMIALGGAAITRARLRSEKAEMEHVARAEHLRTVMLDAVSHHFRSPLAGILGSVTSILNLPEAHDRSVRREFLLIIKEQANRLTRYVENFISLARLESGSIEVNLCPVSLESLIYDVWDTFGEAGGARRYFQVDVETETVRSDPALLMQAFGNVLENAIKYSPEESVVEVHARRQGDNLLIEVVDQGEGASEPSLKRMFDRFYRSRTVKAPGLGLGLYVTRSLIEMLGGEIAAYNRTDGRTGLVVAMRLPIQQAAA
jgi:two-component system sensor histidine kinase KdpD